MDDKCPKTLREALMRKRQKMMAPAGGAHTAPTENAHMEAKTAVDKRWRDSDMEDLPKSLRKKAALEKEACCPISGDGDWRLKEFVNTPFYERAQALVQQITAADSKADLVSQMARQPRRELDLALSRLEIEKGQWLEAQKAQMAGPPMAGPEAAPMPAGPVALAAAPPTA